MSAPLTKDQIKNLQNKMEAEDALIEREKPYLVPEKDLYEHSSKVLSSIHRILDAGDIHEGALSVAERKLKFYGCDFVRGAYLFLDALECPGYARDFILLLLAITGGESKQRFIITDQRFSEISGLSVSSIQRKRRAVKDWQFAHNWKVVDIFEYARDRETFQFPPNEYRLPFADFLARFIREMRETQYPKPIKIIENDREENKPTQLWGDLTAEKESSAFPEYISKQDTKRIATQISGDFEDAPIPERPAKPGNKTNHVRKDRLTTCEAQILNAISDAKRELKERKLSPLAWWSEVRRKAATLISG